MNMKADNKNPDVLLGEGPAPHQPISGKLAIKQMLDCAERYARHLKCSVNVSTDCWIYCHDLTDGSFQREPRIQMYRADTQDTKYFEDLRELHEFVEKEISDGITEND